MRNRTFGKIWFLTDFKKTAVQQNLSYFVQLWQADVHSKTQKDEEKKKKKIEKPFLCWALANELQAANELSITMFQIWKKLGKMVYLEKNI